MRLKPNDKIGIYTLVERLDDKGPKKTGSWKQVWQVRDEDGDSGLVMKLPSDEKITDKGPLEDLTVHGIKEHFDSEFRIYGALRKISGKCDNLVQVIFHYKEGEFEREGKGHQLAECWENLPEGWKEKIPFSIEKLANMSLTQHIDNLTEKGEELKPKNKFEILKEVVTGIAALNKAGYVHQDLTTDNIFYIPEEGIYKVGDYSSVQIVDKQEHTQQKLGARRVRAPEQWNGNIYIQSDVYMLGIFIEQFYTGNHPFFKGKWKGTEEHEEQLRAKIDSEAQPNITIGIVDKGLEPIVRKCLERRIEDRYADAGELLEAIENLEKSEITTPPIKKSKRPIYVVATLIAAAIGIGTFFLNDEKPTTPLEPIPVHPITETAFQDSSNLFIDNIERHNDLVFFLKSTYEQYPSFTHEVIDTLVAILTSDKVSNYLTPQTMYATLLNSILKETGSENEFSDSLKSKLPEGYELSLFLANYKFLIGDTDTAAKHYKTAIDSSDLINKNLARLSYTLLLSSTGQPEEAIEVRNQALEEYPGLDEKYRITALNDGSWNLLNLGTSPKEVIQTIFAFLEEHPDTTIDLNWTRQYLAIASYENKQFGEAVDILRDVKSRNLWLSSQENNDIRRKKVIQNEIDNCMAWTILRLSNILFASGRYDEVSSSMIQTGEELFTRIGMEYGLMEYKVTEQKSRIFDGDLSPDIETTLLDNDALATRIDSKIGKVSTKIALSQYYHFIGEDTKAIEQLDKANSEIKPDYEENDLIYLAQINLHKGRFYFDRNGNSRSNDLSLLNESIDHLITSLGYYGVEDKVIIKLKTESNNNIDKKDLSINPNKFIIEIAAGYFHLAKLCNEKYLHLLNDPLGENPDSYRYALNHALTEFSRYRALTKKADYQLEACRGLTDQVGFPSLEKEEELMQFK